MNPSDWSSDVCSSDLQLAYAIGVAQPVSISINTFGTSDLPESKLIEAVRKNLDRKSVV